MKVVVTGGAGFVGANLCRLLTGRGDIEVVVVDDLSTGRRANLEGMGVILHETSILEEDALHGACAGASSVVHLAAVPSVPRSIVHPRRSHDVKVTGTLAVLDAARGRRRKRRGRVLEFGEWKHVRDGFWTPPQTGDEARRVL